MQSVAASKNDEPTQITVINVGSRESQLALIQTNLAIEKLEKFYSNNPDRLHKLTCPKSHESLNKLNFNVVPMTTKGDQNLEKPLHALVKNDQSKSLFTRELEIALLDGQVDFIVHSLKDLPTTLPDGCTIGAVLQRDSPDDVIVLKKSLRDKLNPLDLLFGRDEATQGKQLKIGTSSLRRIAMVKRCNPNLDCIDIRGNLNTRLKKLDCDNSEYAAIILARAGLDRMGWSDRASHLLTPESDIALIDWCYAVGQGAIAIECRSNDAYILELLSPISDIQTTCEVIAERNLMKKIGGGCSAPLGVRSTWTHRAEEKVLHLDSIFFSTDGKTSIRANGEVILTGLKHGKSGRLEPDLLNSMTGVDVSQIGATSNECIVNDAKKCSNLGIEVANKMINSGCLALMSCKE